MTHIAIPKICYIGNSPLLIRKFKEHFNHQIEIAHYHDMPIDALFDYFVVIDPIEQDIKRIRMQELWKRQFKATNPSVKMLVIDWWPCCCNGFMSPMDIPENLHDFLANAVSIQDSEHCKHCHRKMKKEIDPLFEPHGDISPLIKSIQPIDGISEYIKKKNQKFVNERRLFAEEEFNNYEHILRKNETIIDQTPFKNELMAVSAQLQIWKSQLQSNEAKVFENMKKEVNAHIEKLRNIKKTIGFMDKSIK